MRTIHRTIEITATDVVFTGPGSLGSVHLVAAGVDATLILRDSLDALGAVVARLAAPAGGSDRWHVPGGVAFGNGLHATIAGAGASGQVAVA